MTDATGQLLRLHPQDGPPVRLAVDGQPVTARAGDSVLVAVLAQLHLLRQSEFGAAPRAGFCLMGACQDCWMWTEAGERLRACTTPAADGMRLLTVPPQGWADGGA